jgi:hypothetical protein
MESSERKPQVARRVHYWGDYDHTGQRCAGKAPSGASTARRLYHPKSATQTKGLGQKARVARAHITTPSFGMNRFHSRMTAMSGFVRSAAMAFIIALPVVARGHGLGWLRPRPTVAYYCPAPVQFVPVLAYPICITPPLSVRPSAPQPSGPGHAYARPTPAPPSAAPTTAEPPLAEPPSQAKPSPPPLSRSSGFGESTSFYDAYSVASQEMARSAGDRCKVDFWNLTDRDLVLRIDSGPSQLLPRGKSLPVAVGRQFTWQVEGHQTQTRGIDGGEAELQIVIRR